MTHIGKNADLLILLRYYAEANGNPLYFTLDNQSRDIPKLYYISNFESILGSELCVQVLFLHAFIGCDFTLSIYGVSKKVVFQKNLKGDRVINSCATAPSHY